MELTIHSTPEDVQAALKQVETDYAESRKRIDAEAKRAKEQAVKWRNEKRRLLKALLKVVELPDATGGHAAVEKAAAREQDKQRGVG